MFDSNLKPGRLKAHQDMNRLSRLCRLKGLDMTKGVHYPIWIQGNAKATSKSFLRGGIPEHPSEAAHSAKKNLIKPCAIRMVELVLRIEAAKKMKDVPLSNDVIADGIADMGCDILDQIVQEIKDSPIRIINN